MFLLCQLFSVDTFPGSGQALALEAAGLGMAESGGEVAFTVDVGGILRDEDGAAGLKYLFFKISVLVMTHIRLFLWPQLRKRA
jgi:hypothetical protein